MTTGDATVGGDLNATNILLEKATVTQTTSTSSPVTINSYAGSITVFGTVSADSFSTFTVNNDKCLSTSVVLANLQGYAGGSVPVICLVGTVSTGSFSIQLHNPNVSFPTNATMVVGFVIF